MFTADDITPEIILAAYAQGIFPMADDAASNYINFYKPKMRGQLNIAKIHIPTRLLKTIKQGAYDITINQAFTDIIDGCAKIQKGREESWINPIIRDVFIELNQLGHTHSVECWYLKNGDRVLAGGLYGLAIGQIFCGESMVSFERDASKIALINLSARLWKGNFKVLDTQFTNPHLEQFGVYEIPEHEYDLLVEKHVHQSADFILEGLKNEEILAEYLEKRHS